MSSTSTPTIRRRANTPPAVRGSDPRWPRHGLARGQHVRSAGPAGLPGRLRTWRARHALGRAGNVLYGHLKLGSLRVRVGDQARQGQLISQVGDSGNPDEPHLHIQLQNSRPSTSRTAPSAPTRSSSTVPRPPISATETRCSRSPDRRTRQERTMPEQPPGTASCRPAVVRHLPRGRRCAARRPEARKLPPVWQRSGVRPMRSRPYPSTRDV
jgi:murein DD-endopeptidase MepM/ murein hydrolase activator NlpD